MSESSRYTVTPLRQFSVDSSSPTFPTDALPRSVSRLVKEAAAAIGCPPDAIGLAALTALGSAIGNARVVQPKKGWTEGAAIYAAVIADSGEKKTAAIAVATAPSQKLQNKLNRDHEEKLDEFAAEERAYEVDRKDAAKQGLPAPPPPRRPVAERTHVNDTTVEALVSILKENPRGVLLEQDELVGWVKAHNQYKSGGKGADRQFWLSTWSNRPVSVDRKGQSGPIGVLRPFVSLIGSIQPTVLTEMGEGREDGMLERFLFSYPEPLNSLWTEAEVSEAAEIAYRDLYRRLRALNMERDELGDPEEVTVSFSPAAKEVFVSAYNGHRREMTTSGFPGHLRSPWSKLEAYLVRLTLIMAVCRFVEDEAPERVEQEDVLRAVLLVEYFKAQARRVFGALHGIDSRSQLLEDVVRLVTERGGVWTGTATELHNELVSVYKPERPAELSKFLQDPAGEDLGLLCESSMERFKEGGEWKSRRVLTLYVPLEKRRNGVTA